MAQDANPILNNPYQEPLLHYATDAKGNLNYEDIRQGRRVFTLDIQVIPQRQGSQPSLWSVNDFDPQYGEHLFNHIRREVGRWRTEGYPNMTRVTKELLDLWSNSPERIVSKRAVFHPSVMSFLKTRPLKREEFGRFKVA